MTDQNQPKQKIGALWIKESKKGTKYMSGYVEVNGAKVELILFANRYKTEQKHPSYVIYPKEERRPAEDQRNQAGLSDLGNSKLELDKDFNPGEIPF